MVPLSIKTAISIKNVFILMETQPLLEQLNLPGISGSVLFLKRNGTVVDPKSLNFRDVTFHFSSNMPFEDYLARLMPTNEHSKHLHLWSSPWSGDNRAFLPTYPRSRTMSKPGLFSMATRLTLYEHDLYRSWSPEGNLVFPSLQALAFIKCEGSHSFLENFDVTEAVNLTALMIKTDSCVYTHGLQAFIRGIKCLRELVIHSPHVYLNDVSNLSHHKDNLKLLSLHSLHVRDNVRNTLLSTFSALRHLNLNMGRAWMQTPNTLRLEAGSELYTLSVSTLLTCIFICNRFNIIRTC